MTNPSIELDIGMIVIAAAVNMGIGMLWYSPSVFGKRWMKAIGMSSDHKPKDMGFTYSLMFVASLVTAFALELLIESMLVSSALAGLMVGFWAGIGFVATSGLSQYLFDPHKKSLELYFINNGYYTFSFMVMGFMLGI
jgi:hypothetical protein